MKFYTVNEAAVFFSISPRTIRRMIKDGELIAVKIRSEYRISQEEIDRYIQNNQTA